MNKKASDTIHKKIRYIWKTKIKEDYENGWLLKEHSSMFMNTNNLSTGITN